MFFLFLVQVWLSAGTRQQGPLAGSRGPSQPPTPFFFFFFFSGTMTWTMPCPGSRYRNKLMPLAEVSTRNAAKQSMPDLDGPGAGMRGRNSRDPGVAKVSPEVHRKGADLRSSIPRGPARSMQQMASELEEIACPRSCLR